MDFILPEKRIGRPTKLERKRVNCCLSIDIDIITAMRQVKNGHMSDEVNAALRFWYEKKAMLLEENADLRKNLAKAVALADDLALESETHILQVTTKEPEKYVCKEEKIEKHFSTCSGPQLAQENGSGPQFKTTVVKGGL